MRVCRRMKAWKQDSRPCYTQQTHLDLVTHWHTHTPLSSLRTTWVLLNASDQHTLRPASSCHWSGPSRVLLLLVFLPVQVSGGSTVCLNCWNSAEIPTAASGWRHITCCDWCHLKHYLVVRLATPLLHCCIQGLWERQRRRYFMIPLEEVEDVRQKSGSGFQTRGNNRRGDVTDIQVEHVQSNFLAYILFVLLLVIQYFDTVVLLLLE